MNTAFIIYPGAKTVYELVAELDDITLRSPFLTLACSYNPGCTAVAEKSAEIIIISYIYI